jgi:hypothetical protein
MVDLFGLHIKQYALQALCLLLVSVKHKQMHLSHTFICAQHALWILAFASEPTSIRLADKRTTPRNTLICDDIYDPQDGYTTCGTAPPDTGAVPGGDTPVRISGTRWLGRLTGRQLFAEDRELTCTLPCK